MTDLELADEAAKKVGTLYAAMGLASVTIHPTSDNERMTIIYPACEGSYIIALLQRAIVILEQLQAPAKSALH